MDIFLIVFRLLTIHCKWTFTKRFILSLHHKENTPCYDNSHRNCALVAQLYFLLILLFSQYKTTWLTAINSHCLAALSAQMSHAAKRLLPQLEMTIGDSMPCCCYTMKKNSRTIRSQSLQPPLQAKERAKVSCKLFTT